MSLKEYNKKTDEAYHRSVVVHRLIDAIDSVKWLVKNGYELDEVANALDQQSILLQHCLRGTYVEEQQFSGTIVDIREVQESEFMRMSDGSASAAQVVADGCVEALIAGPDVAFCPCCGADLTSCSCECFEWRSGQSRKSN